jgi:uncharacterized protein YndB with AHSA1/START domain
MEQLFRTSPDRTHHRRRLAHAFRRAAHTAARLNVDRRSWVAPLRPTPQYNGGGAAARSPFTSHSAETRMLKTVGIILLLLLGALLLMASRQPDAFAIERSVVVSAPAEVIYPKIADLHQWSAWSPYEKLDPQMKKVFNGTPGAAGASYYWSGNAKAGEGTMTVRELMPPSKITMQRDILKPIEEHNVVEFNLEPTDGGTRVTWAMRGANSYLSKIVGVFMNMDTMIGKEFEDGLASLKTAVETQ